MDRRKYLLVVSSGLFGTIAGCSDSVSEAGGSGADKSGTASENNDKLHNFELSEGETIRVEVENKEGYVVLAKIVHPNGNGVAEKKVKTEDTAKFEANASGTYRVHIVATGKASYKIFVDE